MGQTCLQNTTDSGQKKQLNKALIAAF